MDLKGVNIAVKLKVYNPNSYGFKVSSGEADILFNNNLEGTAVLLDPIKVKANSEDVVDTRIRVDFKNGGLGLISVGLMAIQKEQFALDVKGKIKARSFLITKHVDFEYKQP